MSCGLRLKKSVFLFQKRSGLPTVTSDCGGYSHNPDKVAAVADAPRPTNAKELRSFLGLVITTGNLWSN